VAPRRRSTRRWPGCTKQANKAIDQRESSLRVEHADIADTANSADTATTAGNVSNQLWAIVNGDGTLFRRSPGIVSSARDDPGQYFVTANRSLANCFFQATLGGNTPGDGLRGAVSVNLRAPAIPTSCTCLRATTKAP
jgi:hypothetical protein